MNDLSTHKRAGLTTFERARFAITYAEAAVGKEKEDRIGDSLSLKSTIKELSVPPYDHLHPVQVGGLPPK